MSTRVHALVALLVVGNFVLFFYQTQQPEGFAQPSLGTLHYTIYGDGGHRPGGIGVQLEDLIDLNHCAGQRFRVYVHQLSAKANTTSVNARTFFDELKRSPYSTENVADACLYVYVKSGRDSAHLAELPFWHQEGQFQLVIFVDGPAPIKSENESRALFVGLGTRSPVDLDLLTDVPGYKPENYKLLPSIFPIAERAYLYSLTATVPTTELRRHFSSALGSNAFIEFGCKGISEPLGLCEDGAYREKVDRKSTFTILLPQMENFPQRLYEVLLAGSVPVIIGDPQTLPYAKFIDWSRAVLHFPRLYIREIPNLLPKIPTERILELRRNGRFYLENFLFDSRSLTRSILTYYRHQFRLPAPREPANHPDVVVATYPPGQERPMTVAQDDNTAAFEFDEDIPYLWNENPTYLDVRPMVPMTSKIPLLADIDANVEGLQTVNSNIGEFKRNLSGNHLEEKFTVVMMSYKRDSQVKYTLNMLNGTHFLDAVILVWNDVDRPVPEGLIPTIHVPIYVLNNRKNTLNNRFLPFDLIRTEAILNMDDDFNVPLDVIEFSFRENRHAIVGPNFRVGYIKKQKSGLYQAGKTCQQNIILTSGAFLHRHYHYAYTHMLNPVIHDHISKLINCEDIAVNFLVSHFTRRPPIKTTAIINTSGKVHEKTDGKGLHDRGNAHYTQRSDCIGLFVRIFGYNPLVMSEFRVESMLHGAPHCYEDSLDASTITPTDSFTRVPDFVIFPNF